MKADFSLFLFFFACGSVTQIGRRNSVLRLLLLIHLFYSLVVNNIVYFHFGCSIEIVVFSRTPSANSGHALLFETSRDRHKFYEQWARHAH